MTVPLYSLPNIVFRPLTDLVAGRSELTGGNVLKILPHLLEDRAVFLVHHGATLAVVYVRSGEPFTLQNIPDGTYVLYIVSGQDWDGVEFTARAATQRFKEPFDFESTTTTYSVWTIDLQPARGTSNTTDTAQTEIPPFTPDPQTEE